LQCSGNIYPLTPQFLLSKIMQSFSDQTRSKIDAYAVTLQV